ncbi:DUF317 domain-containing protein [Streptomyces sp. NPDC019890]|uniref:DUF317 domain-containing protein n=1 Tax=Streptomyces sp. NPDC019890 TaxID=3365064 RepID=UPI00384E365B
MHDEIEQTLVSPRYLAGGGDPAWITIPLHRACGWSFGHDPLMPRVHLSSPDQQALLRIDPEPDRPWWTLQHARTGSQPAWSVSFGARTPVEIIAGFTDALTAPHADPGHAPDPNEPLRQAGWNDARDHDGHNSPDGYAHVEHFTEGGSNSWYATVAVSEDPEGLIWEAYLDGNTPRHLITGFTRALADEAPLARDPLQLPTFSRRHIRASTHQLPAHAVAFALENRVKDLTARHTRTPTPGPRPPHRPPPRRTR